MPVVEDAAPSGAPGLPRLLPPAAVRGLGAHDARYGPVRLRGEALIAEVERSGLAGRGGAAFPAGRKLRTVAARARRGAVLIANGMESEPASAKDASLLARVPHLVLDGIALAAAAVSADRAYLCVHRAAQAEALAAAVAERSGRDPVPVTVAVMPARYVASEASALVHHFNGGPAVPLFTPPRPSERGVGGRPTLVSNVETLANVALISRYGAGWFLSLGVPEAPGSALVTLSGAVPRPGVWEIALGTPLRDVLALSGVSGASGVQAVLTGGYFGIWLPGAAALSAPPPRPPALRRGVVRRRHHARAAARRLRARGNRPGGQVPGRAERRAVRAVRARPAGDRDRARAARVRSREERSGAPARPATSCPGLSRGAAPVTCRTAWRGWRPARCESSPTMSAVTSGALAPGRAGAPCSRCQRGSANEQDVAGEPDPV